MRIFSAVVLTLSAALLLLFLSPTARADDWNKKTIVTFNNPVEVPGHVLPAGTYMFKLMNSDSDRDIVMIESPHGRRLDAIVLAEPAYRLNSSNHAAFNFESRNPKSPEAIKDWFYPGDLTGVQFIYPTVAQSPHSSQSLQ